MGKNPSDKIECPEKYCGITFPLPEEVAAHLQWDHNRSEAEAERMVKQSLDTESDQ